MALFSKSLTSILSRFSSVVGDLDDFISSNSEELAELEEELSKVRSDHARATRVRDKLQELLR